MKKYHVFISSSYEDLKMERDEVIKATIAMGHIPIAMEMFNASDDSAWNLIKRQIDQCDYFVVIVAHKYGSEKNGVSYTEMEYDYANSKDIPIIGLIIDESAKWPKNKRDKDRKKNKKISSFKDKISKKTVGHWRSIQEINEIFLRSLNTEITSSPRPGFDKDIFVLGQGKTTSFWNVFFRNLYENEKVYVVFSAKDKGFDFTGGKPDLGKTGHTVKLSFNEIYAYCDLQKELFAVREHLQVIHGGVDYKTEIGGEIVKVVENPPSYEPHGKLIIIGSPHANVICSGLLQQMRPELPYQFRVNKKKYKQHYKYIYSKTKNYPNKYGESERLDKDYGIMLRIQNPNKGSGKNKILVLGGNHGHGTQAAIQALYDHTLLNYIYKKTKEFDFEAIFEAQTSGLSIPTISIERISILSKGTWKEILV